MELFIPLHDDRFSRFMESFRSKHPTKQRFYTQISTTYWDNTKKSIQPTRERRAVATLDIITCEEFKISRLKTDILVIPVKQIVEPSLFHEPYSSDDFLMDKTKSISIGPLDLPYINNIFQTSTEGLTFCSSTRIFIISAAVLTYVARNNCSSSADVQRRMFDILTMADSYTLYPPLPTYPRHYRHLVTKIKITFFFCLCKAFSYYTFLIRRYVQLKPIQKQFRQCLNP